MDPRTREAYESGQAYARAQQWSPAPPPSGVPYGGEPYYGRAPGAYQPYAPYPSGYAYPSPPGQPYPYGYPPGPGYPMAHPPGQAPLSDSDARLWSTMSHAGMVLFGLLAPLILWAVLKDRSPFVRQNAAAALNFVILMAIVQAGCGLLLGVGAALAVVMVGFPILIFAGLAMAASGVLITVFGIIGAVRANRGEVYRYPFNVSWVK